MKHKGWTNYETWVIVRWIEQQANATWLTRTAERLIEVTEGKTHRPILMDQYQEAKWHLARELRDAIEENSPVTDKTSAHFGLLTAAFNRVNWAEVAEHLIAEYIHDTMKEKHR